MIGYTSKQPQLITRSLVIDVYSKGLKRFFTQNVSSHIRAHKVLFKRYLGRATEREIEDTLKEFTVYLTGIPIKADYHRIKSLMGGMAGLRELYIPQNHNNNFKYFGFAICNTLKDKDKLLSYRKLVVAPNCKIQMRELNFDSYKNRLNKNLTTKRVNQLKKKKLQESETSEKALIVHSFFRGRFSYVNIPPISKQPFRKRAFFTKDHVKSTSVHKPDSHFQRPPPPLSNLKLNLTSSCETNQCL